MNRIALGIIACLIFSTQTFANSDVSSREERTLISSGNEEYENGNYVKAMKSYRKALELNPFSQEAKFNLASTLVNISEKDYGNSESTPIEEATYIFEQLSKSSTSKSIVNKSLFNLGHLAYNKGDYTSSIEYYKSILRNNPDDDKARMYLRMAQLKQNKENKDKSNNHQDEKQEDKKENNEENKDKNDKSTDNENNQTDNKQPPKTEEINDANADRILKSIENKEKETLMRVKHDENAKKTNRNASGRYIEKPW